jgi:hypothetical protein
MTPEVTVIEDVGRAAEDWECQVGLAFLFRGPYNPFWRLFRDLRPYRIRCQLDNLESD